MGPRDASPYLPSTRSPAPRDAAERSLSFGPLSYDAGALQGRPGTEVHVIQPFVPGASPVVSRVAGVGPTSAPLGPRDASPYLPSTMSPASLGPRDASPYLPSTLSPAARSAAKRSLSFGPLSYDAGALQGRPGTEVHVIQPFVPGVSPVVSRVAGVGSVRSRDGPTLPPGTQPYGTGPDPAPPAAPAGAGSWAGAGMGAPSTGPVTVGPAGGYPSGAATTAPGGSAIVPFAGSARRRAYEHSVRPL